MLPRLAAVLHSLKDEVRALRREVNALKEARPASASESPGTEATVTLVSPAEVTQPAVAAPTEGPVSTP